MVSIIKLLVEGLSAPYLIAVVIVHLRRTWQDFFTPERLSLSHRRNKPDHNDKTYRMVSIATIILVVMATFHALCMISTNFISTWAGCKLAMFFAWTNFLGIRYFIYIIFALRLQRVYGGTPYAVKPIILVGLTVFSTLWMIVIYIVIIYQLNAEDKKEGDASDDGFDVFYYEDEGTSFVVCASLPAPYLMFGFVVGFDLLANLGYYSLFIVPVQRLRRRIENKMISTGPVQKFSNASRSDKSNIIGKMLVVGVKAGLLSGVIVFSSVIVALLWFTAGLVLFAVDSAINATCLILMTPYYPDEYYYRRFCKPCIYICDRNGYTLDKYDDKTNQDQESVNNMEVTATVLNQSENPSSKAISSVDTMSQVRVVANAANPANADNAGNKANHGDDESKLAESLAISEIKDNENE